RHVFHFHGHRSGGLQPDEPRVGAHEALDVRANARRIELDLDAERLQPFDGEGFGQAVGGVGHQQVVALLEQRQQRTADGRLSGGKDDAMRGAIQLGDARLKGTLCRCARGAIAEAIRKAGAAVDEIVERIEDDCGSTPNRRDQAGERVAPGSVEVGNGRVHDRRRSCSLGSRSVRGCGFDELQCLLHLVDGHVFEIGIDLHLHRQASEGLLGRGDLGRVIGLGVGQCRFQALVLAGEKGRLLADGAQARVGHRADAQHHLHVRLLHLALRALQCEPRGERLLAVGLLGRSDGLKLGDVTG
ncbi:unnamed protein product, partial [Brugia timori]|uniref:NAD-specific glutamate dehydrogenase n=1 Tax=Brugia timori TaxID=42155 RepID=A0A0R3QH07_9BILA